MGQVKKYARKSVNFGEVGNPARVLVEQYIEKYGNNGFSALMRKLVLVYLGDRPEHKDHKITALVWEYRKKGEEVAKIAKERGVLRGRLVEAGIDADSIF
jgi:hypothetical protein